MNLLAEELERLELSEILMLLMAAGKLTENHIPVKTALNSTGFVRVWWVEEPITGDVFPCVLARTILKEKVSMV